MPVWWGTFAYMMVVSLIGMYMYKSKKASATLEPVDDGKTEQYRSIGLVMALLTFALLAFFAGNRTAIHDTQEYQYHYDLFYTGDLNEITNIINGTKEAKGSLFYIYLILFKHFTGGTYNDWFLSIAIIQCVSFAIFFYKYSVNFTYSVFLFCTTSGFIWMVNGMRQLLAVSLVLFFTDWIFKRKTIPFIIVIVIAYFIHSASLLWLPVYFLINFKPWSIKFNVSVLLLGVALIFYSRSSYLSGTEYSYLTEDVNAGINPLRVAVYFIPAIFAFVKRKELEDKKSDYVNTLVNLSVVTAMCYLVGYFSNGVVARIAAYFTPFTFILLPLMIKEVFDESMGKTITLVSVIGYLFYFWFEMYIARNGIYASDVLSIYYWSP